MKVETVEDVVASLPCDGATTLAIIGALGEAGLLRAYIIRGTCPTCVTVGGPHEKSAQP